MGLLRYLEATLLLIFNWRWCTFSTNPIIFFSTTRWVTKLLSPSASAPSQLYPHLVDKSGRKQPLKIHPSIIHRRSSFIHECGSTVTLRTTFVSCSWARKEKEAAERERERRMPVWKHKEVVWVTWVVSVFNQCRDSFEEPRDSEVNWPPPEGRDNVMRDQTKSPRSLSTTIT